MFATYYDSAEGREITKERALQEIRKHSLPEADFADFAREYGWREGRLIRAQDLLAWLGY